MMNARVVSYAEPSNLEPEVHEAVDDAVEAGAEVHGAAGPTNSLIFAKTAILEKENFQSLTSWSFVAKT